MTKVELTEKEIQVFYDEMMKIASKKYDFITSEDIFDYLFNKTLNSFTLTLALYSSSLVSDELAYLKEPIILKFIKYVNDLEKEDIEKINPIEFLLKFMRASSDVSKYEKIDIDQIEPIDKPEGLDERYLMAYGINFIDLVKYFIEMETVFEITKIALTLEKFVKETKSCELILENIHTFVNSMVIGFFADDLAHALHEELKDVKDIDITKH